MKRASLEGYHRLWLAIFLSLAAGTTQLRSQPATAPLLTDHSLAPWQNLDHTKAALDAARAKLKKGEKLTDTDRVRIVIYGQSLCAKDNSWVQEIVPQQMKAAYGDIFTFTCKARGGWTSKVLVAVYPGDIEPTDPDLVIIHDYPSPDEKSYAALLFAGCKDKSVLERWGNSLTEDEKTKKKLSAETYLANLGKPGIRNMVNSRGNRVEVLLLSDHCVDIARRSISYDIGADKRNAGTYPLWAKENALGYLDLRTLWKEAVIKKFGNLSSESRSYYLKDGEHLSPAGQRLWAHCVLAYFGVSYDYDRP